MARIRSVHPESWPDEASAARYHAWHIYVLQEDEFGPIKVGLARNAFWRCMDLQVGNPRRLNLRFIWTVDDRLHGLKIESEILQNFVRRRLSGEWLSSSPEEVQMFVESRFSHE